MKRICFYAIILPQLSRKGSVGRLWLVSKLIMAWKFTLYVRKYCCKVVLL